MLDYIIFLIIKPPLNFKYIFSNVTMNIPSDLTFMLTHSHSYSDLRAFENDPLSLSTRILVCLSPQPVRTMINDRNMRPRWSNVNHHPHSARGAGNPYMATLWQWRMLGPSGACLASTNHLSYLSELSFQSIRRADIWMVFNILVGMALNGRKEVWICVCVCVCARESVIEVVGEKGKVKMSNCWRGVLANVGVLCVCVCGVEVWGDVWWSTEWMLTQHTQHTHTYKCTQTAFWHCGKGLQVLITTTFQSQHRIGEQGRAQPCTLGFKQSITMPECPTTTSKFNNQPSMF